MASGTGNLPNPGMDFTPFDILTAEEMDDLVENIESLADGSGIGDGAIDGSKIANYKIGRNNNGSNTTETAAKIKTGWGVITNTAANSITANVTFDEAFTNIPIIQVSVAGDTSTATGDALGNGGNNISGSMSIKHYANTTSGFTVRIYKTDGVNFAPGKTYFTWIAIGT